MLEHTSKRAGLVMTVVLRYELELPQRPRNRSGQGQHISFCGTPEMNTPERCTREEMNEMDRSMANLLTAPHIHDCSVTREEEATSKQMKGICPGDV